MRKIFNDTEAAVLCELYLSGLSTYQIAERYGVARITVEKTLKRHGCPIRSHRRFTDEQESAIAKRYADGEGIHNLARSVGCSPHLVWDAINRNNVPTRRYTRKYRLDESAFENITEQSAYFAGYLFADGCITDRGMIKLVSKDYHIVEDFKNYIGATHPIKTYTNIGGFKSNSTIAVLVVISKKIASDLSKFGIIPRKSLIAKIGMGMEHNRDFMRGLTDGDGWLCNGKTGVYWGVCGSKDSMEQVADFVLNVTGFRPKLKKAKSIFKVVMRGARARQIINHLYSECSIALKRKKDKAKEICGSVLL